MYASSGIEDKKLTAGVFDSPFCDFGKLAIEIGRMKTGMPKFLVKAALNILESTIKEKANFNF